jgi:hypothetical protein
MCAAFAGTGGPDGVSDSGVGVVGEADGDECEAVIALICAIAAYAA